LDGVLVDTGPSHFRAWAAALRPLGLELTPEMFRRTFGMNNQGVLTTLLGDDLDAGLIERVDRDKEAAFRESIRGQVQALPGAVDWLERLQAAGLRQAVASSAPPENIEAILSGLRLGRFFDALVSGANMPGKPDPAVFLEAARRVGVEARACVVVEDAAAGVEAARRAGMRCVAVTNTNSRQALAAADIVVDSLAGLPPDAFSAWLPGR
jgi:HAD superfamily hydrolase (TIGR01509 family)